MIIPFFDARNRPERARRNGGKQMSTAFHRSVRHAGGAEFSPAPLAKDVLRSRIEIIPFTGVRCVKWALPAPGKRSPNT